MSSELEGRLFTTSATNFVLELPINGIIYDVFFLFWFFSFVTVTHVVAWISSSLIFIKEQYSIV